MRNLIIIHLSVLFSILLSHRLTVSSIPDSNVRYVQMDDDWDKVDIDEQMEIAKAAGEKMKNSKSEAEKMEWMEKIYAASWKVREKQNREKEKRWKKEYEMKEKMLKDLKKGKKEEEKEPKGEL